MSFRTLNDAINKMDSCKTDESLRQLLTRFINVRGVDKFSFSLYSQGPSAKDSNLYYYASRPIRRWRDYYDECDYACTDQWLRRSYQQSIPMKWCIESEYKLAKTPRFKQHCKDLIEYGLSDGLYIPSHGPFGSFYNMTLYRFVHERGFELSDPAVHEIFVFFMHFTSRFSCLHTELPESAIENDLTERELQCMRLTSENYTAEEISDALGISTRTVSFHIQNVMKKFGVKSKYQVISLLQL